jgi:hypothetical protein
MKIYFIKKANKNYPTEGIEKGDEYYYCEPKSLRKTTRKSDDIQPKRYQLGFYNI